MPFHTLPTHILEEIAALASAQSAGPPASLPAILTVSRAVKNALAFSHLKSRIFRLSFDTAAPARRLGRSALTTTVLATELEDRCRALTRIRHDRPPPHHLDPAHDYWKAYLMLLEDDGKNVRHLLEYARVRKFIAGFNSWLQPSALPPHRWPAETPANALCAWILALTDSRGPCRACCPRAR